MKLNRGRTEWIPVLATLIISVLLLVGCTSANASHSPVINSLTADSDVLLASQTCEIACNASHFDGESLSYQWSANGGSISGEGPVITWTAPDAANTYTITVSVSNGKGSQSVGYLSIDVISNTPPDIESLDINVFSNSPPDIESLDIKEDEVTVSASYNIECAASDQNGYVLSYKWSASGGSISGEGSMVTWTAPDAAGTYTITVTVSDGQGGEDTASLDIDVLDNNNPPEIKGFLITNIIGSPVEKDEIYVEKHYYIECRASDPDGDKLSYDWWVSEGTILEEERSRIFWLAPDDKAEAIFEVTVRDERGGEDIYAMQRQVYLSKCDSVD